MTIPATGCCCGGFLKYHGASRVAGAGKDVAEAVQILRDVGEEKVGIVVGDGASIIMIAALGDAKNVIEAFGEICEGYVVKPIDKTELIEELTKLELIS